MKFRKGQLAAIACVGLASMVVTGPVLGEDQTEVAEVQSTMVSLSADEIVAARRATYFLSTQAIGQIKAGIDEGGDLRRTASGAKMLANWAKVLPTLFPEGTDISGTRALATVWSDREGFEARAAAYRDAALELAKFAGEGNRQEASAAFKRMAGTCHACHETYREE